MTLNDFKNNGNLFMYLTLSDLPLFTHTKKDADRIFEVIQQRSIDENIADLRYLINTGRMRNGSPEMEQYITEKMGKYFRDNFVAVLEENEDVIDVEKYLLTAAYRAYKLIEILDVPENRRRFPAFDMLLPYKGIYANTIIEIDKILRDSEAFIDYTAVSGPDASGFWDDLEQKFVSVRFTRQELREVLDNPLIQKALTEEPTPQTVTEAKRVLDNGFMYETANTEALDLGKMAEEKSTRGKITAPRRFPDDVSFDPANDDIMTLMRKQRESQERRAEEERKLLFEAIKNNGVVKVDKNKYVAVFDGKQANLPADFFESIIQGSKREFKEYIDDLKLGVALENAGEIFAKMDIMLAITGDDPESIELVETAIGLIKRGIEERPEMKEEFEGFVEDYIIYADQGLSYETVSTIVPLEYIKKYGRDDALVRRYKEIERANIKKAMLLYKNGAISFEKLEDLGFFTGELSHRDIFEFVDSGYLNEENALKIIGNPGTKDGKTCEEYVEEVFKEVKKDKKLRSMQKRYLQILPAKSLLRLFAENEITDNDLIRNGVKVEDIQALDRDLYLAIALKEKLPRVYELSEDMILERYGSTLTGKDLIMLVKESKISEESILETYVSRKSVEISYPENALKVDDVLDLYDAEMILKLEKEGKLNSRFIENYREGLINALSEEEKKKYFDKFVADLEVLESKEGAEAKVHLVKMYELYKKGILPKEVIMPEFNTEVIEDLLLEEHITEDTVLELYTEGLAEESFLKEVFGSKDIEDLILSGRISKKAVTLIDNPDERIKILKEMYQNKEITESEIMDMYLSKDSGISIDEFEGIFDGEDLENIVFSEYINDPTTQNIEGKIEELFKRYYISQDELSVLVGKGVLSAEKSQELSDYLNSHREFEKIFGAKRKIAILTSETEAGESRTRGLGGVSDPSAKRIKIDPELQRNFLKALGADDRVVVLEGINNSLDGYEIYGFEKEGLMVFGKFDSPNNSTYVMTIAQGSYFLKSLERKAARDARQDAEKDVLLESSATKQELRDTEHVKVKNACAGWGKNIVTAMRGLSPRMDEKLAGDRRYKARIDELVEEIKEDYQIRKEIY